MTAFEKGYDAFLRGVGKSESPFDKDTAPFSRERWLMGWNKAQRNKSK